ncbi:SCO family protein [Vibrio mexicanus]|uniref:SCO family protein n=1 Tax=Vibrio mexicanus TaxID=1004326 RepID=UPI00063C661E|nr:SCO family protein [Vibrio mexicanus]
MNKRWILALAAAFALGIGAKQFLNSSSESGSGVMAELGLQGKNDQAVALFNPQDERIRIVYFGFTHCPDVCPTSLAMLAGALNQVDQDLANQFWPVFISLDPDRDHAAKAHEYAQYFHPAIDGASTSEEKTKALAGQYGVIFRRTELENSQLEYTVDHSSYFYFLKPDGTLIQKVPHTLTPAPIVQAMTTITSSSKG